MFDYLPLLESLATTLDEKLSTLHDGYRLNDNPHWRPGQLTALLDVIERVYGIQFEQVDLLTCVYLGDIVEMMEFCHYYGDIAA